MCVCVCVCVCVCLSVCVGEEGGGGGGGEEFQACVSCLFSLLVGKKQHRNIFSHNTGPLVKFGWILPYLKIGHYTSLSRLGLPTI